jgi:cell division protein FtsI/penicillin-binding protein 2
MVALTLAMLAIVFRVGQLQTQPPEPIARLVNSQNSTVTLIPRRGSLVDRHGRPLSGTHLARRLFVDPQRIEDPGTFSERVGYGLDYNPAKVEQAISARINSRYVVIDPLMDDRKLFALSQLKLAGLGVEQFAVRQYPMGHLAGQVIGFVGVDDKGLDGLEQHLDSQLRGQPGKLGYWRDAQRKPIWVEQGQYQPPVDGRTIRLTLDAVIQNIAETELQRTVDHYKAESGQIIVMHPRTGHILAMANYPFFDPNDFRSAQAELRRNRCVTDTFEPGSTFKPFVWAAVTEKKAASPTEMFDTTTSGVYVLPFGRRLRDARPHGLISWEQVLITSSNIGMAKAAMRLSTAELYNTVRAYGFGEKPSSGLPGEVAGMVHPLKKWNQYSMSSIPMGHEIAVTPLQLVKAFTVFTNDGLMVNPRIVYSEDHDQQAIGVRILKPETAIQTRQLMRRVITEGTGRRANSPYYSIFGKSGTAEVHVAGQGGYKSGQYIANFLAAAPLDNPQVIVLCVIHKPDKSIGHFGGTVAGPPVMRVIEQTLPYLGVAPDLPTQDPKAPRPIITSAGGSVARAQ